MTRPWMRWTDDDIATLRTMAKKYPTDQIAQELDRRVSAIYMKAHELGISLRRTSAPQEANPSAVDATG
jgi:hypothetical protein